MKTKLIRFLLEMAAIYGCIIAVRWPLDHAYDATTEILAILVSGIALAVGFTLWQRARIYGITKATLYSFDIDTFETDPRIRAALELFADAEANPIRTNL
jgi:hypothetical protein